MKKFKFSKVSIIVLAIAFTLGLGGIVAVRALAPGTVVLNTADNFAILAGAAISDTGSNLSSITGDVGLSPTGGTAITQLSCSQVTGAGLIYDTNNLYPGGFNSDISCRTMDTGVLDAAKADLKTAYNYAKNQASNFSVTASNTNSFAAINAGSYVLAPGVYTSTSSMGVPVALELNGGDNPNAVFIFQADSTLDTVTDSVITLTHGTQACNVFWQVGSSATLETGTDFSGTIMAAVSITAKTGSTVDGRLLADANNGVPNHTGAVTLDETTVTVPTCVVSPTLNVIKHVSGGTASAGDWVLTVASSDVGSGTGYADGVESPGTAYTLETGHQYSVTENAGPSGYTPSLSDDCTIDNAEADTIYNCTITNTYTPVHHSSSGSSIARVLATIFEPTITILSTPVVTPIVKAVVIPTLPITGFPPQSENTPWYKVMLSSFLNFFK